MKGNVTVYGPNIMRPPLYDGRDANMVVFRDEQGDPSILLVRLSDGMWGLSTPDDKDWPEMLTRFGLLQPRPLAEVIASAMPGRKPH